MKLEIKKIIYYNMGLILIFFLVFGLSLIFQNDFQYYDYGLFASLAVICMLTLHVGLIVGLILCVIVIFGYGSVVFFQMITNSIEIWTLNYIWFLIFPIATFFSGQIRENLDQIAKNCEKCKSLSDRVVSVDEITGFGNAREFLRDLDSEMARAKRHKLNLTLAILKIQYFEELLAIYGVENLKDIYRAISQSITVSTRVEDLRYRVSEDELALILPHTDDVQAKIVKDRIKQELSNIAIDDISSLGRYNIELKIGLVQYSEDITNPMEFKNLASKELEYDV